MDSQSTAAAEPAECALWLARLSVSSFRNYAGAELCVDSRPVVLCGPNGAGKTNLLEAVSYLAPGRGLRRARLAEVARRAPGGANTAGAAPGSWAVAATVMTPEGPRDIGTGRDPGADGGTSVRERRLVRIDGAPARSQQSLGEVVAMVWLTPQMDDLFREGAAGRRRFFDRLVYGLDPAHARRVASYEQAMRERTRLLKAGRMDDAWLGALEEAMACHGVAIAAARRDMVARLSAVCAAAPGPFPVAGLALAGEVEAWLDDRTALAAEEELRRCLGARRAQDTHSGGASLGPHRSDLEVTHLDAGQPAGLCSTGEQKALLISIVLAHARLLALHRGTAPLMLLDEVAAHLDATRLGALFQEILALGTQAWLTGTDISLFAPLDEAAQFFQVRAAKISPAMLAERV